MKKNKSIVLAAPALIGFLAFYFCPFLIMGWYSVSFGMGRREFVGLQNFVELYQNQMFLLALKNTLRFMAVSVPVILAGALYLAICLQRLTRGAQVMRLSLFYPMLIPIGAAVLGVQMLWGEGGAVNWLLVHLGGRGEDWIHTSAAFWILCILYWWKFLGYHVLLFFVRLQMIPKPYYEYARLSGAGRWTIFRKITWPFLVPTFLFNLLLALMNVFKCYREAFLLGGNYPDSSIYFLQHFMNNSFQNLNYQKIAAVSVSMMGVIMAGAFAGYCLWKKGE